MPVLLSVHLPGLNEWIQYSVLFAVWVYICLLYRTDIRHHALGQLTQLGSAICIPSQTRWNLPLIAPNPVLSTMQPTMFNDSDPMSLTQPPVKGCIFNPSPAASALHKDQLSCIQPPSHHLQIPYLYLIRPSRHLLKNLDLPHI